MTTNIERAAEVIRWVRMDVGRREGNYPSPEEMARALADAGLLVTDEMLADVDDHLLPALLLDRLRLLASKEQP